MNKGYIFFAIAFFAISLSYGITVERTAVPAADFGEQVEITFFINPDGIQKFDFTETLPAQWEILSWGVQGISKESVLFSQTTPEILENSKTVYSWAFENALEPITLTYIVVVNSVGEVDLKTMWFYEEQIESQENEFFVRSTGVVCGDNICQSAYGENLINCPGDCPFKSTPYFWISLLLFATIIVVTGVIYRESKKIKMPKRGLQPPIFQIQKNQAVKTIKKPEKVIHFEIKERTTADFPKPPVMEQKTKPKERIVRSKPKAFSKKPKTSKKKAKKTTKKPAKPKKKQVKKIKKTAKRNKPEKFYKDTLSRLEKIKKELK